MEQHKKYWVKITKRNGQVEIHTSDYCMHWLIKMRLNMPIWQIVISTWKTHNWKLEWSQKIVCLVDDGKLLEFKNLERSQRSFQSCTYVSWHLRELRTSGMKIWALHHKSIVGKNEFNGSPSKSGYIKLGEKWVRGCQCCWLGW